MKNITGIRIIMWIKRLIAVAENQGYDDVIRLYRSPYTTITTGSLQDRLQQPIILIVAAIKQIVEVTDNPLPVVANAIRGGQADAPDPRVPLLCDVLRHAYLTALDTVIYYERGEYDT